MCSSDLETGQGTLIVASDAKLEDFSFSLDGTQLYGTVDTELWRYDLATGDVEIGRASCRERV